ncbi:MAG: tRNA (guanosine-2'-O-)-methyltransferase [Flavobacteriales bacterium]|jgi:tRNA (guanosine-2'-O-)-methyltransferase
MEEDNKTAEKSRLKKRMDAIKDFQCKDLIAVLEEPTHFNNIGKVIRCVNTLGVDKLYVIDSKNKLPDEWEEMRKHKPLLRMSASAIKWSFVKKFASTKACLDHLEEEEFISMATSPHQKGKKNIVLQEGDFTHKKLAVWFGSESNGLSEEAIERSEACVNIEMYGIIESMNLSASAAIVLYEITRQRRAMNV